MKDIGKLTRVALREVWRREDRDFTSWLQENLDILNDILDRSLSNAERERPAGDFNVDLVAEDEEGNPVVIENQLEKSNHEHLGKLLTYLTAIGAKTAIWIVSDPRPEHITAVSWLNESSSGSFYLVKVEAVQIGDSPPAPLLTLITGPSEESKEVGAAKKEIAERYNIRYRFWTELLERAKNKTKLHATISPGRHSWISAGAGKAGLAYVYALRQHGAKVELYIDRGKESGEENKRIFDQLYRSKESIEKAFGGPLSWERLEGKRACRIAEYLSIGGYRDDSKWHAVQDAMIDAMIRFEKALKPHIGTLKI